MNRLRTRWMCIFTTAFVAISAAAAPPLVNTHNRTWGSSVDGGSCTDIPNGFRCRAIQAWENYDLRGTFEYTEAAFSTWSFRSDPGDGSFEESWRTLTCPVDRTAISANSDHATFSATLDPAAPGCYQWGETHTWDPINGDQWFPSAFGPGPRVLAGEWKDPFNFGTSRSNFRNSNYDGSTGSTETIVNLCHGNWGDTMRQGGFSINGRFYAFEGPDGQAWSSFYVSGCNDANLRR